MGFRAISPLLSRLTHWKERASSAAGKKKETERHAKFAGLRRRRLRFQFVGGRQNKAGRNNLLPGVRGWSGSELEFIGCIQLQTFLPALTALPQPFPLRAHVFHIPMPKLGDSR